MAVYTPVDLAGGQRWIMIVAAPVMEITRETTTLAKMVGVVSVVFLIPAVL